MWLLWAPICLAILGSSITSATKPHFLITVPAFLEQGIEEKACVTFLDLKEDVSIKIELKKDDDDDHTDGPVVVQPLHAEEDDEQMSQQTTQQQTTQQQTSQHQTAEQSHSGEHHTIVEKQISSHDHSGCYSFQVPKVEEHRSVWKLHVSLHGDDLNVEQSRKVVIIKAEDVCIIQTDRSTYKPGDTVKFRMMTVNEDFHPVNKQYPLIQIIDTHGNRIAQWLDVSTKEGMADFSVHLASELLLGDYKIEIPKGCNKHFKVDEYVNQRFEVNINLPSEVHLSDKSFHLEVCGRYTYGEAVEGKMDVSLCAEKFQHHMHYEASSEDQTQEKKCIKIQHEQTDSKGCVSRDIQIAQFGFSSTEGGQYLAIKTELTEDGTSHSEKASAEIYFTTVTKTIEFVDCENIYHKGFPYQGKVKIYDEKKNPIPNERITIYKIQEDDTSHVTRLNVVTDADGIAPFKFETSKWKTYLTLGAGLTSEDREDEQLFQYGDSPRTAEAWHWITLFYSKSGSRLSIGKHSKELSCNSDQTMTVEYDIQKAALDSSTDHLHFFYFILSKTGISSYKEHRVDINQAKNPNPHGSFPLKFHIDQALFPAFSLVVFSMLSNGETIAAIEDYYVSPCAEKQLKLEFSKGQVQPGEHVNLEVTADAGSVCSVRSLDKGYLLKHPNDDHILATDVTALLRSNILSHPDSYLAIDREEHSCPEDTTAESDYTDSAFQMFERNHLKVFTNTDMKKKVNCIPRDFTSRFAAKKKTQKKETDKEIQKHITRTDFPEAWLFEFVHVGPGGHTVLNLTAPHSITKFMTDGFCLSKTGFASVKDVEFTVFQSYFLDVIIPPSVVQGEQFPIQVVVFSYAKECHLVFVSLSAAEDLITDKEKEQYKCVCGGHSHTFSWDASTLKPKPIKIHVESGSVEVEGGCTKETLLMGKDYKRDSVMKTIGVKPRGHEDEKTKTFLMFPGDKRDAIPVKFDAPERLVLGSERAHVLVLGDPMANSLVNLEDITHMPDGCGEQNMAKFARYMNALKFLKSIDELTPEVKAKIVRALTEGYQHQLTYRTENGSYVIFPGLSDNIWLTAYVVRGFLGAQDFIYIDEKLIEQSINWLHSKQLPDGSFKEEGHYFNNYLEDDDDENIFRTAYVIVGLLEHKASCKSNIVEAALGYLRKSVNDVKDSHTQSILAYVFALSGDHNLRNQMLKKLDESAVKTGGMMYWKRKWGSDGEPETASYTVLALLSDETTTTEELEECTNIIRWLMSLQNAWGGFYSSQDTTLGLQAMAKYAEAIKHKKEDVTVTITSNSGFKKTVHVDKRNSLLVQQIELPDPFGEYSISATGEGFVSVQPHLHFFRMPDTHGKGPFSFNVSTEPSVCTHASYERFDVHVDVSYGGARPNSNMAVIVVETVSGYVPNRDSVKKMEKDPIVERTEITAQNVSIYLKKVSHEAFSLVFCMEQEAHVENLQPANAAVIDYYNPVEYTVVEYSAPCSSVVSHCAVAAGAREDCGFPNISKEQCEQRGCCFDSSTHGAKWCFHQGFKKATIPGEATDQQEVKQHTKVKTKHQTKH
ncbi:alpha-2-macroglobulin-like [Leptodactylus fuscus]|uniref:alpha-2-macroglobulin-like n=1 Tax=Leptodactylus fuscus TaxID=238119 RepID=UPI003F4F0ED0